MLPRLLWRPLDEAMPLGPSAAIIHKRIERLKSGGAIQVLEELRAALLSQSPPRTAAEPDEESARTARHSKAAV